MMTETKAVQKDTARTLTVRGLYGAFKFVN